MPRPTEAPLIILTQEFSPTKGGVATFTMEMALAASRMGRAVEVWAPQSRSSADHSLPFAVRRLGHAGSQSLPSQLALVRELLARRRQIGESILYATDPGAILSLRALPLLGQQQPLRLLVTVHGSEILSFQRNPLKRLGIAQVFDRAHRISAPSLYTLGLLGQCFPALEKKAVLTPCCLPSRFLPAARAPRRESPRLTILTLARLHPRKGQLETLEALSRLPPELRAKIHYRIAGSGQKHGYAERLRRRAASVDFPVTFEGDVPDESLPELYASADLFAMTSVPFRKSVEGFGLVYLEAAAHGLPVIAHRIGGVAEAIDHERTGLLVSPDSPQELTAAFERLLSDPTLRTRMAQAGPAWARRHSWEQNARILIEDPSA